MTEYLKLFWFLLGIVTLSSGSPSDLKAEFRKGHTFITFTEEAGTGHTYRLYRSVLSITDVSAMTPLVTLQAGTSYDRLFSRYHVIEDLGTPLSATTGLFVHTPHDTANAYYAVTTVTGGVENRVLVSGANVLAVPVAEQQWPVPLGVLTEVKGGATSTAFYYFYYWMDYFSWSNAREYYGNFFLVGEDPAIKDKKGVPLFIYNHALNGGAGMPDEINGAGYYPTTMLRITAKDPNNTWWWGTGTDGYTEKRLMTYIRSVIADPRFSVDINRVYMRGSSMGAGGTVSVGYHNPDMFAALAPMLAPIEPAKTAIVTSRPGREFPPMVDYFGAKDSPDFGMQGHRLLYQALMAQRLGIFGKWRNHGHQVAGWSRDIVKGDFERFRRDELYPAFGYSNRDYNYGVPNPAVIDSNGWVNSYIDWSSSLHRLTLPGDSLIDCADSIRITFQTYIESTIVDITPRRVQHFKISSNQSYGWTNVSVSGEKVLASGTATSDAYGRLTVPKVLLLKTGNRLILKPEGVSVENQGNGKIGSLGFFACPNPMNSMTTLELRLSAREGGRLEIFDAQGKRIRDLSGLAKAGRSGNVVWDGKNEFGNAAGSGIYFARLHAGGDTRLIRLVFLK